MTSKRLGRLLLALVAVWSFAGLDWQADQPTDVTQLLLSPTPAYAGDPDDVGGEVPPPPDEEQPKRSLWETIVDAVESLLGGG